MSKEFMEKMAAENPAILRMLEKTAAEINASPFRDETLGEMDAIIEKAAVDWGALAKKVGPTAKHMGTLIGTGLGGAVAMHLGTDLYDAARRGITKSRNYKAMLQANPDIAELAQEDPEGVKAHFNTLHKFNPEFSGDPSIAAAYVRQGRSYGTDLNTVNSLVTSRKNIRDARSLKPMPSSPFQSSVEREQAQAQLEKTRADTQKAKFDAVRSSAAIPGGSTVRQRAYAAGNPRAYTSGNPNTEG